MSRETGENVDKQLVDLGSFTVDDSAQDVQVDLAKTQNKDGILTQNITLEFAEACVPRPITIQWTALIPHMYTVWSPLARFQRYIGPDWMSAEAVSRAAVGMPVQTIIDKSGNNCMTVAVSDVISPIKLSVGVQENNGHVRCQLRLFDQLVSPLKSKSLTLRIDCRPIPYYQAIGEARAWWSELGYENAEVPPHARLPMYSTWYSFHQALNHQDVLAQCRLAKDYGMESVLIDAGWEHDHVGPGFSYCGDWNISPKKIPDLRALTRDIHQLGMKCILWFAVPFAGINSQCYRLFQDKLLHMSEFAGKSDPILDPRYAEVRANLVSCFERAVRDWDMDGLKLDFIDCLRLQVDSAMYNERMDQKTVEQGVITLLEETKARLTAVKPDVMLEFRQQYIGPVMQHYGNMFRVGDCPYDALSNRTGIIDLRLTSGSSAVHSDMLMWHKDAPVEQAAMQLANVLFGVPQISVRLEQLSDDHREMLRHYLRFWRDYRDVLIDGTLIPIEPAANYSLVSAYKDGRAVHAAYSHNHIKVETAEAVLVNVTGEMDMIVETDRRFAYQITDCMGHLLAERVLPAGLSKLLIPLCGFLYLSEL